MSLCHFLYTLPKPVKETPIFFTCPAPNVFKKIFMCGVEMTYPYLPRHRNGLLNLNSDIMKIESKKFQELKSMGLQEYNGAPVWTSTSTKILEAIKPTVTTNEYGRSIELEDESTGHTLYARVRSSVPQDQQVFDIVVFEATRDASGKTDAGIPWSIKKGDKKPFAV